MALTFDRRVELGPQPGTHALICGVGSYPAAEGHSRWALPADPAAATTANQINDWLISHSNDLVAPLATCRLLLSGEGEGATLYGFLSEAAAWRDDAAGHRDGMTFCYLVGAGLLLTRAQTVFLLEDFGAPVGGLLRSAVTVESIVQGMTPSEWAPEVPRTQLVFVDIAVPPSLIDQARVSTASAVFDVPLPSTVDDRDVMKLLGVRRDPSGPSDGPTRFAQALLESLEGSAGELVADGTWAVTTAGLGRALASALEGREYGAEPQGHTQVIWEGRFGESVVIRLASPPKVPVEVELTEGIAPATLVVEDHRLEVVTTAQIQSSSSPLRLQLEAGIYLFGLELPDGARTQSPIAVKPPGSRVVLGPGGVPQHE